MKYRPECLIGVALIESGRHLFWQVYRVTPLTFRPLGKNSAALLGVFVCFSAGSSSASSSPTDPVSAAFSEQWIHRACETSGTALGAPAILGLAQSKGQSI